MPIYEYRCGNCNRKVELLFKTFTETESAIPECPHCSQTTLARLVSKVTVMKSWGSDLFSPDSFALDGVDENDPVAMQGWMNKMRSQMGDDSGHLSETDMMDLGIDPDHSH